jgi:pilus assembly protein TadC
VTENTAKDHLRAMLASFTAGMVLHMLAEVIRADADQAGDDLAFERGVAVEKTLFVVGLGVDAALPH